MSQRPASGYAASRLWLAPSTAHQVSKTPLGPQTQLRCWPSLQGWGPLGQRVEQVCEDAHLNPGPALHDQAAWISALAETFQNRMEQLGWTESKHSAGKRGSKATLVRQWADSGLGHLRSSTSCCRYSRARVNMDRSSSSSLLESVGKGEKLHKATKADILKSHTRTMEAYYGLRNLPDILS